MPRSPSLLLATAILAVVTALILLVAGFSIRPPDPPALAADPAVEAQQAVVRRFYEAANAAIASGDSDLAAVVTPDYVEVDAAGEVISDLADLERYLLSLHERAPGLRLAPDSVAVEGDRAIALVRLIGDEAELLGLTLAGPPAWGPVDVFRIAGGRIAERASTDAPRVFGRPVVRTTAELRAATTAVTVQRAVLPPGGWRRGSSVDGMRWLYVESGALAFTVAAEWDRPAVIPAIGAEAFATGERLLRLDGAGFAVRNVGAEPAVLLEVLAVVVPSGGAESLVATSTGVPAQVLAGGQAIATTAGMAAVDVGRLSLSPGAAIGWGGGLGAVLAVVEHGEVALATTGEAACVRRAADGSIGAQAEAVLTTGDGAMTAGWTGVSLRNSGDEPAELLVVTLLHDSNQATPAPTAVVPAPTAAPPSSFSADPARAEFPEMRSVSRSAQAVGLCA